MNCGVAGVEALIEGLSVQLADTSVSICLNSCPHFAIILIVVVSRCLHCTRITSYHICRSRNIWLWRSCGLDGVLVVGSGSEGCRAGCSSASVLSGCRCPIRVVVVGVEPCCRLGYAILVENGDVWRGCSMRAFRVLRCRRTALVLAESAAL